jgi:hypothetical protein
VRQDMDNENVSLYDARIGGGYSEPPAAASPCEDEGCRGPIEPRPDLSLPGAVVFQSKPKSVCRRARHGRHCQRHRRRRGHGRAIQRKGDR